MVPPPTHPLGDGVHLAVARLHQTLVTLSFQLILIDFCFVSSLSDEISLRGAPGVAPETARGGDN